MKAEIDRPHMTDDPRSQTPDAFKCLLVRIAMRLGFHHAAVIESDYAVSKVFHCDVLWLDDLDENYRTERGSWKLDFALNCGGQLALFNFPDPPARPSRPGVCALRYLAFRVGDLDVAVAERAGRNIPVHPVRIDEVTGRRITFLQDPDGLPLEFHEVS